MNQEQYEAAGELREKIVEIEKELEKQRRAKRAGTGPREEVTDTTVAALRLRSELQRAVEEENYEQAAAVRKQLAKIEVRRLKIDPINLVGRCGLGVVGSTDQEDGQ